MTLPVHIGFTGPRKGLTEAQKITIWNVVGHRTFYAHHGDCVGGDATFDAIVRRAPGLYGVIMRPSNISGTRAHCVPRYPHDVVHEPEDPLVRDKKMVDEVSVLIGAPNTVAPVLRSGTWTTIRYAQEKIRAAIASGSKIAASMELVIVLPNGAAVWDCDGGSW